MLWYGSVFTNLYIPLAIVFVWVIVIAIIIFSNDAEIYQQALPDDLMRMMGIDYADFASGPKDAVTRAVAARRNNYVWTTMSPFMLSCLRFDK